MSRIVLALSHSIEEFDMLRLLHSLGHEVVSLGGYINPHQPHDDKRPALPELPYFPEVQAAVDAIGSDDNLSAAQHHIPDAILDWLGDDGAIIYHHFPENRLPPQWKRLRDWKSGNAGRRIIWRSVGQSVEHVENVLRPLRRDGLERVAYSPKEANIPGYIGHDALIRFYKSPDEWTGWHGGWDMAHNDAGPVIGPDVRNLPVTPDGPFVVNVTQHLAQREPYTNFSFWDSATTGLPRIAAGPGSEVLDGVGSLSTVDMQALLRGARVYLYTGTQPASYTLGLIEAMMTGIPVVSIHPWWMRVFPYGPLLFEGHELATFAASGIYPQDHVRSARSKVIELLNDHDAAREASVATRAKAIELFGIDTIRAQWGAFLGAPVAVAA